MTSACFSPLEKRTSGPILIFNNKSSKNFYKLAAPRKGFYLATFFQYKQRLLRQKTGRACLYMPQDGHWLASFEVIPPPPKVSFPAAKKMKIPRTENCFPDPIFFLKILAFYCLCGENFVTPFSTLAMIKGSLPTNSTTPDRLRCRAKADSVDFPAGFLGSKSSKIFFFQRPGI